MTKAFKFNTVAILLFALLINVAQGEAKDMTSYERAGLEDSEDRAFFSGLLEGFAFSIYSRVDSRNPSQISNWNNLTDCLQSKSEQIFLVINNVDALGGSIDKKFPEIFWDRAVPVVCKNEEKPAANQSVKLPVQVVSHMDWHHFSKKQKRLYIRGNLEAFLFFSELAGEKKNTESLKKLQSSSSLDNYLKLFADKGIDYRYPIPWSIVRANGTITGLGKPYPEFNSKKIADKNIGAELVELWGRHVDLTALSQVCTSSWESQKSTIRFRAELLEKTRKSHACVATEIKENLLPSFFKDQSLRIEYIRKMQGALDEHDVLPEKIRMVKSHVDSLNGEEANEFCRKEWMVMVSPSQSLRYKTSALTYLLTINGGSDQTLKISNEMERSCGLSKTFSTLQK